MRFTALLFVMFTFFVTANSNAEEKQRGSEPELRFMKGITFLRSEKRVTDDLRSLWDMTGDYSETVTTRPYILVGLLGPGVQSNSNANWERDGDQIVYVIDGQNFVINLPKGIPTRKAYNIVATPVKQIELSNAYDESMGKALVMKAVMVYGYNMTKPWLRTQSDVELDRTWMDPKLEAKFKKWIKANND